MLKESHWFKMTSSSAQTLIPQTEEDISEIKWVAEEDIEEYLKNSYATIESLFKAKE